MMAHVTGGGSFKGAGLYLLHDKREKGATEPLLTTERVAWTHALNTLEDEPSQVIAEMQQTCLNQNMLKLMSGHRGDGRPTTKPVVHVSLSWSPDQPQPDRAGMIAAAKDYLSDRGLSGHQCLIVAHNDTEHRHIHLLINSVHPDTGMTADQCWRRHHSLQWARRYDAAQGFFLDKREAKHARGEQTERDMTRAEWEAWKAAGGTKRPGGKERAAEVKSGEWDALKAAQQDERKAFFKETASLRGELREAVKAAGKAEFADQWQEYARYRDHQQLEQKRRDAETRRAISYLRKQGQGASSEGVARLQETQAKQHAILRENLAEVRAPIIAAQTARIAELAAPALADMEQQRAAAYELLKAQHRDEKKGLHRDQAAGERRPDLAQRQRDAADRLAEAGKPAPPQPKAPAEFVHPYKGNPRPAFGITRTEAVRRAHAFGTDPRPAEPRDARMSRPEEPPAVDMPAARETGQPAPTNVASRTDRQAIIESLRAKSAVRVERGRSDGDGGRDRDR